MAKVVNFQGVVYATSTNEAFYGNGSFDTVTYAAAPSSLTVGDYDLGVIVDLANPVVNTGWAFGDTYFGVERVVGSQYTDFLYGTRQENRFRGGGSPDFI